jgi:hypothetical protein
MAAVSFLSSDLDSQIGGSLPLQLNRSRSTTAALEKNLHDLFPSQDKAYNFEEDTPDNIGLEVLVLPPDPLIDIIFVHGFWGGARKSWSKSANPANFWPKEWLRKDPEFKHARISSYGYAGDFYHQDGPHDLSKVGTSLFHELKSSSYINDNRMVCQRAPGYGNSPQVNQSNTDHSKDIYYPHWPWHGRYRHQKGLHLLTCGTNDH